MSDDLEFIVIDDIPEYIFCIGDDEENERVIALSGKDGAFKYEKVAELPTTGEDGVLYLVPKSHTTQTASGNPISVNITDNAGKIESLKLDGDTYQQTYTGKNLFDKNSVAAGTALLQDGTTISNANWCVSDYIPVTAGSSYTLSGMLITPTSVYNAFYDENKTFISSAARPEGNTTYTAPSGSHYMRICLYDYATGGGQRVYETPVAMLEAGATATDYEPYVGGQPSPNPSYPQPIQTVTGEQTVSINGTDYSIDLGSIELCKLGTYKDYIYKDGESWKVHKATDKSSIDGTIGTWSNPSTNRFNLDGAIAGYAKQNGLTGYCEDYVVLGQTSNNSDFNTLASNYGFAINFGSQTSNNIRFKNSDCSTIQDIQSALLGNPAVIYYALATATDTVITDTDLIAQLEAIRTASLETGTNTISNTATGTNLAGDLEIGYYGYDPLNKYDKYFWLDIDGGYESL